MCPHCKAVLGRVNIKDVSVGAFMGSNRWNGIAYCCPTCQAILSVSIDPIAIKTDTIDELAERLGKR